MLIGVFGAVVFNAAFGLGAYVGFLGTGPFLIAYFASVWALNSYFQSFSALALIKVNSAWFHVRERGVFSAIFGSMIQSGRALIFVIGGIAVMLLPWQWVFFIPAGIMAIMGFLTLRFVRDSPEDELSRIDLGAVRVPVRAGVEMRLDMNEAQQVIAVTLVNKDGQLQIGVFAAPRNEGIWDDIRKEIRDSIVSQGGLARDRADGAFGTELVGTLKSDGGNSPVRFLGVDGPRWFLRGMILGAAATEAVKARAFEDAFRNTIVVRGLDPLPVRDPVPLQLPREAADQLEALADAPDDEAASS